mgnify:CR=1 FL=1
MLSFSIAASINRPSQVGLDYCFGDIRSVLQLLTLPVRSADCGRLGVPDGQRGAGVFERCALPTRWLFSRRCSAIACAGKGEDGGPVAYTQI